MIKLRTGLLVLLCMALRVYSLERPNIVFILADDLGWSDTSLYGTTKLYQTPNLERLAKRGMTFSRAYAASPLCSPTRASILTGLAPARHGITAPTCHKNEVILKASPGKTAPPNKPSVPVISVSRLKTDYKTLPKALKAAGYVTGHFGKWHLGREPYSPLEHGFEVDVPHWPGPGPAGSYVAPWKFPDFKPRSPQEHIEDRMATEAVGFMKEHAEKTFFLNYWMFSVHAPFDAKKELVEKYRTRIDPNAPQRSPTYAAMIESMDDAVGTLLDGLDGQGLAERTIIVFASDNGGNMYNEVDGVPPTDNAPLRGGKATMFEGGVRGPCVVVWPGIVKPGSRSDAVIQSCDFYPSLLEMIQLEPEPDQRFDGISIVPALKGDGLKRDAIFTYFPHNPSVPDWLPPSVSVHLGVWKLIRLFHAGANGEHDWRLYHLGDDLGETNNLALKEPERVKSLDAMIERYLNETDAVRPFANPKFDPAKYRPELIGRAVPKKKAARRPAEVAVAGWRCSTHCRATVRDGALVITSTGNDPYMSFRLPKPIRKGAYALELTMASKAGGLGQVFWEEQGVPPRFFRERSVVFDLVHDGRAREYRVPFTASNDMASIRIDPGQKAGEIVISKLKLRDADERIAYEWKFF